MCLSCELQIRDKGEPRQMDERERDGKLEVGLTGRWYIANKFRERLAWTGSAWSPHEQGIGLPVQISNFETREEAAEYAAEMGIKID
jgi:hypothetical protein